MIGPNRRALEISCMQSGKYLVASVTLMADMMLLKVLHANGHSEGAQ